MHASSESTSQFWNDFWATIYHFTHPFSSTFFDQLFESQQAGEEGGVVSDPSMATNTAHATTTLSQQATPPAEAKHFASQEAFQKYWEALHAGQQDPDQPPQTVLAQLQASWLALKSMTRDFMNAINWQQWWIQAILTIHVLFFVTIVLSRNSPNALTGLLLGSIILAALSEPFNRLGHKHWREFADDNYFDDHGVFTTVVWAMPLLFNALLAVILLVRKTVQLLVKVKRAQIAATASKKRKKNK